MTWFLKRESGRNLILWSQKNLLCQRLIKPNSPICMAAKSMSILVIPKCTGLAHASLNSHKHIRNPSVQPSISPLIAASHTQPGHKSPGCRIYTHTHTYRASTGKVGLGVGGLIYMWTHGRTICLRGRTCSEQATGHYSPCDPGMECTEAIWMIIQMVGHSLNTPTQPGICPLGNTARYMDCHDSCPKKEIISGWEKGVRVLKS